MIKNKKVTFKINENFLKKLLKTYKNLSKSELIRRALDKMDTEESLNFEKSINEKILFLKEKDKIIEGIINILRRMDRTMSNMATNINQITHKFHLKIIRQVTKVRAISIIIIFIF